MPKTYRLFLFIIIGVSLSTSSFLEQDGSITVYLEHSLTDDSDSPVFTPRGNITIQSLRLGQAIVNQDPLTVSDQNKLKELASSNQLYFLRSKVVSQDGSVNSFRSTVKACMLAEAELDDRLSVSLDYYGRVIGVSLIVASTTTCEGADVDISKLREFTTTVYVRHTEVGPVPDTATYIQKLEREREAKERGETKDNRSFFAKYWIYIVPAVIIMLATTATTPDAAQGGGQ